MRTTCVGTESSRRGRRSAKLREIVDLTDAEIREVNRSLTHSPTTCGITADRWNPVRVVALLHQRFGARASAPTVMAQLRSRGLVARLPRAREPRLTEAQRLSIEETLRHSPQEVGIDASAWTRQLVSDLIFERYGIRLAASYATHVIRTGTLGIRLARRPRRLTVSQVACLKEHLARPPRELGFEDDEWTHSLIRQVIEKLFHVRYNRQSIRRFLQRWRLAISPPSMQPTALSREQLKSLSEVLQDPPYAWGLDATTWTTRLIAQYIAAEFRLHYRPSAINALLRSARIGVAYGQSPGGRCALNSTQLQQLRTALSHPPAVVAIPGDRWTQLTIARYVMRAFNVEYEASSVPKLLRRLK